MILLLELALAAGILVGVVLVISGHRSPLDPAPPDVPVMSLPSDRTLTAQDVLAVRFPLALRGYRMAEVDELLDRTAAELMARDAAIAELLRAVEAAATHPETFTPDAQPAPSGAVADESPAEEPMPAQQATDYTVAFTATQDPIVPPTPTPPAPEPPTPFPQPAPEPTPPPEPTPAPPPDPDPFPQPAPPEPSPSPDPLPPDPVVPVVDADSTELPDSGESADADPDAGSRSGNPTV